MSNKTKTFVVEDNNPGIKIKGSTLKIKNASIQSSFERGEKTKIANINPYNNYFPSFYVKELKDAKAGIFWWLISGIILIGLLVAASVLTISNDTSATTYWVLIVYSIPLFIFLPMFIIHISRYTSLKQESQSINFKDQKTLSINVLKLYKRLKVTTLNANWFCGLTYTLCVLVFIGLIIAAWAIQSLPDIGSLNINNWNIFKDWAHNPLKVVLSPIPGYEGYFICFLVLIITFVTTIFIHTFSITTSYLRITRIENYYNSFIITPDEVDQYKKKVNRRNAIIFAVVVLVVGLIVYFAYKKVKANKEKAAQVITISK